MSVGSKVRIKRDGKGGEAGKGVTDEKKNQIISKSVTRWQQMGLTREQIALGIATMNVESGFNMTAKGPSDTEKGLGQFNDPTWEDAVKHYNKDYRGKDEPKLDPGLSRLAPDAQINVMGAWIERIWPTAVKYSTDPRLEGHSIREIAYALWHEGASDTKDKVDLVKKFLDNKDDKGLKPEAKAIFNDTYDKVWADQLAGENAAKKLPSKADVLSAPGLLETIMDAVLPSLINPKASPKSRSRSGTGGTLRHDNGDYKTVWRIEPDGSARGHFVSE